MTMKHRGKPKLGTGALLSVLLLSVGLGTLHAQGRNALEVQKARNEHVASRRNLVRYPITKFDLSALPHYVPTQEISGTIRMTGSNYVADSHIGEYWEAGFKKFHPNVKFVYNLKSPSAAIPALFLGVSDLGPSRRMTFEDLLAYERLKNTDPIEIVYATGSYDVPGWSPAFGIFVNKSNPLTQLTMAQLEGIFGAERTGAWEGTTWHPERARSAAQNIRTWGQLGLTGEWKDKPIHAYGVNLRYHQAVRFEDEVLEGSSKWNPTLMEYANYSKADGTLAIGAELMLEDLSKDPYGIAYSETTFQTSQTKALAIASKDGGPYIPITVETVQNRTYPLHDQVYMYLNPGSDPTVKEFMRYILSQEGQMDIARDGKYLPLTADMVKEGRRKLE
ncbi:PstS family phosphate ABC transporter substrate-binding protein [Edaphobacter bradus]|uniref:PstS family phosphate ABC transporter substrate-binding protein n=1 Tax=Edaphobacter bradus TaxID=2259016 RepID=UPI0021DF4274|nr:substrate-binding domain-containing protein [Edaphobacter bradus]